MKVVQLLGALLCLGFLLQVNAWAGDTLTDVLKEKGMITKEDWIRIQAAEEQKAEEAKKKLDEEFPVIAGWGKKGFYLRNPGWVMENGHPMALPRSVHLLTTN